MTNPDLTAPLQGPATEYLPGKCATVPFASSDGIRSFHCSEHRKAMDDARWLSVLTAWCPQYAGRSIVAKISSFNIPQRSGHTGTELWYFDQGTLRAAVDFTLNSTVVNVNIACLDQSGNSTDADHRLDLQTMTETTAP